MSNYTLEVEGTHWSCAVVDASTVPRTGEVIHLECSTEHHLKGVYRVIGVFHMILLHGSTIRPVYGNALPIVRVKKIA